MNRATTKARSAGSSLGDHPVVEKGARLGYAANGLLHLLIAWIALQLAWGNGGGDDADETGALRMLADQPLGAALLWAVAIGFALLGLWSLLEAAVVSETKDRLKHLGKGVLYLGLMGTAIAVLHGAGDSDGPGGMTSTIMDEPWGPPVVVLVGLGIIGVGGYHVVKGWTAKFLSDLRSRPGAWVERAGRFGYIAKGAALIIVGGLFVATPWTGTDEAPGLDGALRTVLDAPFGAPMLTVVALGLAAYGVYSFARARYAKV